jgi:hypothetical protein
LVVDGQSVFTTKTQIFFLHGFLCAPGVLAVNAELQINRQDAKDAKKTRSQGLEYRL